MKPIWISESMQIDLYISDLSPTNRIEINNSLNELIEKLHRNGIPSSGIWDSNIKSGSLRIELVF